MNITIDHLSDGAARAEGVTVIIDVFRAYSVESYAFARGAKKIYPIANLEDAYALKRKYPSFLLAGERKAQKPKGFDYGNSPTQLEFEDLSGKTLIHTTSAGTQGIIAAAKADRILVAALVNAKATAQYIQQLGAKRISLVCMGYENRIPTEEDTICAEYISSVLKQLPYDKQAAIKLMRETSGKRFFVPEGQSFAPIHDFELCTQFDRFSFAMEILRDENGMCYTVQIPIDLY